MTRNRAIRYLHAEKRDDEPLPRFVIRQVLGLISLIFCLVLSVPGVPGPGILFFVLTLFLLDYPGKKKLFLSLRRRRFFRIARVLLWKKWSVFLVLPMKNSRSTP